MITGIHFDWMDLNVPAGKDFDEHCNGAWRQRTEIPAGYGSWGTLKQAGADVLVYLHGLMENLSATRHTAGSNEQLALSTWHLARAAPPVMLSEAGAHATA